MELKGITWDHERGYNPLLPVTEAFCKSHPDVTISWTKRSLKDFGDYPVSKLVENYDFILIDHPFMAEALQEKLLLVLNDYLEPSYLDSLAKDTMGLSLDSYCVNGLYQALPVDAATQVAVANGAVFQTLGVEIPKTFQEVLALKNKIGGYSLGTAMAATDIFSIFFGFVAQLGGRNFFDINCGIGQNIGEEAARRLYELAAISHPDSFEMNPIQILDAMSTDDKIIYSPYVYGYTNYSRDGFRKHLLEFWDAPLLREDAELSTQLGGVGISIAGRIAPEKLGTAVAFAQYLASPDIQRGIYTKADGQPATRSAWADAENNRITRNFFRNTAQTLDTAFTRPKIAKWNTFQEEESVRLHREVQEKKTPREIAENFNRLYCEICLKR